MIKLNDGQKATPKTMARHMLLHLIVSAVDSIHETLAYKDRWDLMTVRERDLVRHHAKQQANRLLRLIGFEAPYDV